MKIKKIGGVRSGQGGCERRIKFFVSKKIRGGGGGGVRVNVNEDLKFL